MKKVISEMTRVTTKSIFVVDILLDSHEKTHLLFDKSYFDDPVILDSFYKHNTFIRYNAYKKI